MRFIIMCGGTYGEKPKQLLHVKGECIVERTIRLLRKCGSCKHFCLMPSLTSRCYGKCEKGRAGYKPRSTKACALYEKGEDI